MHLHKTKRLIPYSHIHANLFIRHLTRQRSYGILCGDRSRSRNDSSRKGVIARLTTSAVINLQRFVIITFAAAAPLVVEFCATPEKEKAKPRKAWLNFQLV
jgi:hypothetical protein